MPIITPNKYSIRERIMQALKALFADQKKGIAPENYSFAWDSVNRFPIGDGEKKKPRSLAIIEGQEAKVPGIGFQEPNLIVTLEWYITLAVRDEPATEANEVLTTLHRRLREDFTLGGLAINIQETGNIFFVDDANDRQIEGEMTVQIIYKHNQDDPRAIINL